MTPYWLIMNINHKTQRNFLFGMQFMFTRHRYKHLAQGTRHWKMRLKRVIYCEVCFTHFHEALKYLIPKHIYHQQFLLF